MPLNYAPGEQVSGWRFVFHRLPIIGMRCVQVFFTPIGPVGSTPVPPNPASDGIYEAPEGH
jgi:hypothetical protein